MILVGMNDISINSKRQKLITDFTADVFGEVDGYKVIRHKAFSLLVNPTTTPASILDIIKFLQYEYTRLARYTTYCM